jgi:DNA invertase Pin-like site-specific DNA recombinase
MAARRTRNVQQTNASNTETRVVGYIRVSTEEQATDGSSLGAQRAKLAAYALAMDLDLVAVHEDAGRSAKDLNRPGLRAALATLDEGDADGLLVVKLDRATRSVRDLAELLDSYFTTRFALLSVGDHIDTRTAAGRLVLNVLVSVGQWEREATAERVRDVMQHLARHGVRFGAVPLELKRTDQLDEHGRRTYERNLDGEATIRRARQLRAKGATLREIAATLSAEGRSTAKGGRWAAETVRLLLERAAA